MTKLYTKTIFTSVTTTVLIAASSMAHATPTLELVSVQPRMVTSLEQACQSVAVQRPAQYNQAGMILGTIAGAALGNQVGGGSGKAIATAAGAVLGGHYGRGEPIHGGIEYQNVCNSVPVTHQKGEIVTFRYKGKLFSQIVE